MFFFLIGLTLVICRFPSLLDYQLNPDEGEFLSAAHKLFYNGNFFQSVDCGTSGPLNIYPLMLPAAFGISPDYASSRLLTVLIAFSVILLLYASFREFTSDRLSRIAILPAALTFSGLEHPNLIHYSSEQIPLLLIAGAIYTAVRLRYRPEASSFAPIVLGLLTGCAFFAKMQSVPMVGTAAIVGIWFSGGRRTLAAVKFAAGLSLPLLANAWLCVSAGVWNDFWASYIITNRRYVDVASDPFLRFTGYLVKTPDIRFPVFTFLAFLSAACARKWFVKQPALWAAFPLIILAAGLYFSTGGAITFADSVGGCLLLCALPVGALLWLTDSRQESGALASMTLFSIALSAVALFSIYKPHRLFPHYLLLLIPPLSLLTGVLAISMAERKAVVWPLLVVLGVGLMNQTLSLVRTALTRTIGHRVPQHRPRHPGA